MEVAARAARWLAQRAGYTPLDPALFAAAFTHRSAGGANNERLEFLGDSVLNLVATRYLYDRFEALDEGSLSRLRARLVSGESLARVAADLGLGEELELGAGELKTGGFRRASILADAFEAVCGALYLDAGLDRARSIILMLLAPALGQLVEASDCKDPKTLLQEWLQARGLPLPIYTVASVQGDAHAQVFAVRCSSDGHSAEGSGASRRKAEQAAASLVLKSLGL